MASFVRVELPKCSICLEGFGSEAVPMSHRGGELHPFHMSCLQNLLNVGNQRDPIYGMRPIQCPVCKIELPRSLPPDPIRDPAPSVHAASNQLSTPISSIALQSEALEPDEAPEEVQRPEHYFDRLSREAQMRAVTASFNRGEIDHAAFVGYIAHLRRS